MNPDTTQTTKKAGKYDNIIISSITIIASIIILIWSAFSDTKSTLTIYGANTGLPLNQVAVLTLIIGVIMLFVHIKNFIRIRNQR
jgi:TRAP-type C4-dicarboxylate transport system permease small subunit